MDAAPTYDFWSRFAAILFAEVAAMAVTAWGLGKFSSSGVWRRTVWHVCLIGLVVLVAAEMSGLGRIVAARFAMQAAPADVTFQYSETLSFAAGPVNAPEEPIVFLTSPESSAAIAPHQWWWPAILWLAGFAIVSLWAVFLRALFAMAARHGCRPATEGVASRAQQVGARLGLRRQVDVVEIGRINAPVAFGIIKAKIGVPEAFSEKFTAQQQEVMLAHELAHVAGRDAVWHLLADFVMALLWWHPAAWWARRRLHFATEAAADEASMVVKDGPTVLAETLVALGGDLLKQQRGALGMKGLRSGLALRVQQLMSLKGDARRQRSFGGWMLKLCGPVLLAAGTMACFAWTGSSSGTPRDEWQNSLAGRTFAALSAAAAETDLERIPGLLGDARILIDAGKLDHAEGLCEEVLKIDSENSEALRLIDAISKARKTNVSDNVANKSGARPAEMERILPGAPPNHADRFVASQTNFSTEERRRQMQLSGRDGVSNVVYTGRQRIYRLLETHLPSVMYDNVPLREVLRRLRDEIRERDPEKEGIDFFLSAQTPLPALDSSTGRLPLGPADAFSRLEGGTIRIVPPLQNVTLGMALDAICKAANPPVYYSITEYAIVFSPTERETSLHTRTYTVDLKAIMALVGTVSMQGPENVRPPLKERDTLQFRHAVDAVRAFFAETGADLKPPKAIFYSDSRAMLMVRTTLADHDVIERALRGFVPPARQVLVEVRVAEFLDDAVSIKNVLGIDVTNGKVLNDPQHRLVIRALEQAAKVDLHEAQRVTTLDGQQARFELQGLETLGLNDSMLHVVPLIRGDGRNIDLVIMSGGRETATARLHDRHTAIVPLPSVKEVYVEGVSFRILTRVAFVTVTIIDAAGNRVHPEEQFEINPFEGIWRF